MIPAYSLLESIANKSGVYAMLLRLSAPACYQFARHLLRCAAPAAAGSPAASTVSPGSVAEEAAGAGPLTVAHPTSGPPPACRGSLPSLPHIRASQPPWCLQHTRPYSAAASNPGKSPPPTPVSPLSGVTGRLLRQHPRVHPQPPAQQPPREDSGPTSPPHASQATQARLEPPSSAKQGNIAPAQPRQHKLQYKLTPKEEADNAEAMAEAIVQNAQRRPPLANKTGRLTRRPPRTDSAPLPTLSACPDILSLSYHLNRNSYTYSLHHIAVALRTLTHVITHGPAASSFPLVQDPTTPTPPSLTPDTATATATATASYVPDHLSLSTAATHARRLCVLVATQPLGYEKNIRHVAACLQAVSDLPPAVARYDRYGELAWPFLKRLAGASCLSRLREEPPQVLVSLLEALARLRARTWGGAQLGKAETAALEEVASRTVAALQAALSQGQARGEGRGEGGQEANDVSTKVVLTLAAAAVDLPQPPYRLLKLALQHATEVLLPQGRLNPHDAVQLLSSYGKVLAVQPGSSESGCSPASGAGASAPGEALPGTGAAAAGAGVPPGVSGPAHSSPGAQQQKERDLAQQQQQQQRDAGLARRDHKALADALLSDKAAGAGEPKGGKRAAKDGGSSAVSQLVVAACRGLGALSGGEVAELVVALGQLGAGGVLQGLTERVTPRLLQELPGLTVGQLAGVAHAYHTLGVAEPGLLQAIGDQIASSSPTLDGHAHAALARVYGTEGSAVHAELQALLQRQTGVVQDLESRRAEIAEKERERQRLSASARVYILRDGSRFAA